MTQRMKYCRKCQKRKPIVDFHRDKNKKDGRTYQCKPCAKKTFQIFMSKPGNRKHHNATKMKNWRKNKKKNSVAWKNLTGLVRTNEQLAWLMDI